MDINVNGLFETLNVEEVSELLEKDMDFKIEDKAVARIKALTFQKINGKRKQSFLAQFKSLRGAAVAACMFVVLGGGASYAYYQAPVAYLDVDINPSIELGINRWDLIVSAKAYNSDGEGILKARSILNKKAGEGVKVIMEIANEQGFLDQEEGAAVAITSVTDDTDKAEALTELSKEVVEEYSEEESLEVEVVIEKIALERIAEARQIGITPGKLNLIQKLQALDSDVKVEEYKDMTVKEIMKTTIALKKEQKTNPKQQEEINTEDSEEEIIEENDTQEDANISLKEGINQEEDKIKTDKKENAQVAIQKIKENNSKKINQRGLLKAQENVAKNIEKNNKKDIVLEKRQNNNKAKK